jgi:hypothetical protein
MPHLEFCANCGSDRLEITGATPKAITVRCYVCTNCVAVEGVILGAVDFLAGAKSKVEGTVSRALDDAKRKAKKAPEKPAQR